MTGAVFQQGYTSVLQMAWPSSRIPGANFDSPVELYAALRVPIKNLNNTLQAVGTIHSF